jgi:hypothetical protein
MGRSRSFLGSGLAFVLLGSGILGLWYHSGWGVLGRVGAAVVGMGALLSAAGLYFRWQGWE